MRAGAQDGSGTWREAAYLLGGLSLFGSRRNSPRAPSPQAARAICRWLVQARLRDFVRASEPGVREAASLEQRRKLSPSLSNFEEFAGKQRARVSQGRTRGPHAAQPGSRGREIRFPGFGEPAEAASQRGSLAFRRCGPHPE